MTDPKPAKATPAKPTAAKAAPAKATAAKTPASTAPAKAATAKTPVAKTVTANTPAAKTAAAKTPAAKPPAAKAPAAKTTAAQTAAAKPAPAARAKAPTKVPAKVPAAAATSVAPIVPVIEAPVPVPAAAPAGWYQVAPGSPQQRYWDGAAWTEHLHDPATAQVPVAQGQAVHPAQPTAPEGTNPNTVWIWLTVASLVIGIAASLFQLPVITGNYTSASGVADSSVPFLVSTLLSLVELVAYVVFAVLDWRALGKRGVPRPFHWAWSLFAIILSSPIVYVIGRTVVVKRRTGKGLAPLWVFIALQVVSWVFGLVVLVVILTSLATQFSNLLSDAGKVL